MVKLRRYSSDDIDEILQLFYDTVHNINIRDYTKQQVNAWADGKADKNIRNASFAENYTIVAEKCGKIVGFGDIDSKGYLDMLYVHKDFQGQGIASKICDLLEKGFSEITVHASITAKGFFENRGYSVIKEQSVLRSGVFLTNFVMKKQS